MDGDELGKTHTTKFCSLLLSVFHSASLSAYRLACLLICLFACLSFCLPACLLIIINLIYIAQFDTNGILTALKTETLFIHPSIYPSSLWLVGLSVCLSLCRCLSVSPSHLPSHSPISPIALFSCHLSFFPSASHIFLLQCVCQSASMFAYLCVIVYVSPSFFRSRSCIAFVQFFFFGLE